jgi:threonine synthase
LSVNLSKSPDAHGYATGLKCVNCGEIFPLKPRFFICPKCGIEKVEGVSVFRGAADVVYDCKAVEDSISTRLFAERPFNALRYRELLGLGEGATVSLGEGGTPLLECKRLAGELGLANLRIKNESQNPTHSFKDRESVLVVNKALSFGARCVSCVSSGNAAASLAAYAARAGLGCSVLMPATASKAKISQCTVYGAKTLLLDGIYEDIFELYFEAVRELDIFESSAGHNRFRTEGDKTLAYEISEQLDWKTPEWIIDNVGNGSHLYGMWKGFKELRDLHLTKTLPRMVAVGPRAGAPVVRGFKEGVALPLPSSSESIAEGLVGRWGYDTPLAVKALIESDGHAEYVSDIEITTAMKQLARLEGVFVEPSAAACVAGLSKMTKNGMIDKGEQVVCIITGSGMKHPESALKISNKPIHIRASAIEIRKALKSP